MNPLIDKAEILSTPEVEGASDVQKIELPEIDNANALLADESINLPPEIIEGVLHQGLKGVLGSNSKARKTWILLDAAISVASGQPFWKWRTRKGRVIYINFEIPRAFIRSRIKCLCDARGIRDVSNLDVWTLRGHGTALWRLLPALLAKIETGKYVLIIIDPIYKGLGGRDENSAGDIGELCNELEQIAVATGAAVLYAAHFSKGNQAGKEAIDRIGGSGVWTRDADTIITLTKHQVEGAYTVDLILRNQPEQPPFVVEWSFPLMRVASELDPDELKQVAGRKREHDPRKLLAVIVGTTGEKPISIAAWAAAGNIPRQTLTDYLPEMRQKGWIATTGAGNAARQYLTEKGQKFLRDGA
jgi:predicted transcriptional regulator